MDKEFAHLHLHTEYSLLDGMAVIDKTIKRAKELGMTDIAITDHGTMYGVVDFYKKAKKEGLHPIIGCEVYVASRSRFDKEHALDAQNGHLVLLCKNSVGYQNLIKLVSCAFTEGFYYKPRVDKELLKRHSEGLIALSACLNGEVPRKVLQDNVDGARTAILEYIDIFGKENYYIELQDQGIPEEKRINPILISLAKEYGLEVVATNDVHYTSRSDADLQDVLMCIQTGKTIYDTDRMKMTGDEFYLKSYDEMVQKFSYIPSAISNTMVIANRCKFDFDFDTLHLPSYDTPNGENHLEYLKSVCYNGFFKKYDSKPELIERLEYELEIIEKMGYTDYFLIVWDFIKYAKEHGIAVGPGRGSAAGSMASYCLDITTVDPIHYNLLFERFLNPDRVSMPDIDVDFCYERRGEVIDYVVNKYGKENVSQIITFGTMKARAAVRDVGRALNVKYADVDHVAKLIPHGMNITIKDALILSKELKVLYNNNDQIKKLIDVSILLEGLPRHASMHAAGIVVTKNAVSDYVPVQMSDGAVVTQFPMGTLEELGLLKMDFLGLRNLTIIKNTVATIKQTRGIELDIDNIDFNDQRVYKMIVSGDNECIFQLEGGGPKKQFLRDLKPENLEDIVAAISLYRPGPMDQIPRYIKNKENPKGIVYKHPALEKILSVTYGCMVYQEQVMQLCCELAGYSVGRADLVRRAMSKKKLDVMEKERHNFIYGIMGADGSIEVDGALRRGMSETDANIIFDEMIEFAKYAFNKSHAVAYAVVAYQTAYLKAIYTTEYMAAILSAFITNSASVGFYIAQCKKHNIKILPPSINKSTSEFGVEDNAIRFSLSAVKNVGASFVAKLIAQRQLGSNFRSFDDFCKRMSGGDLNKRCVEGLIKSGAFDEFFINRRQLMAVFEKIMDSANAENKSNIAGQMDFFGASTSVSQSIYPKMGEYSIRDLLSMEKETMGIFMSGHPLDEYREELTGCGFLNIGELAIISMEDEEGTFAQVDFSYSDGNEVNICGIVVSKTEKTTKSGNKMAFLRIEDLNGSIEVMLFPNVYASFSKFEEDDIVIVKGTLMIRDNEAVKIAGSDVCCINDARYIDKKLYIKIKDLQRELPIIKKMLTANIGVVPVYLYIESEKRTIAANKQMWVTPRFTLIDGLRKTFGSENIKLV